MNDIEQQIAHLQKNQRASFNGRAGHYSAATHALLTLARGIQLGTLTVILPDGERRDFCGKENIGEMAGHGVLVIHHERVARRFFTGGILGFCEAYLDGEWSSPDRLTLFEVALRNEQHLQKLLDGSYAYRLWQGALNWVNRNSKKGSRRNIAYHYDLGNDFYREWLDPSMTYSAALFNGSHDLQQAQQQKYAALAQRLMLQPQHHLLEVGCGWGGFAEFAAKEIGAKVTGITISREQYDFAAQRMQKAGLNDKVEIKLIDYRDVQGQFDRVASIEMFEAVGEQYWPVYFHTLSQRLKSGGMAGLQIITIAERYFELYRRGADYIQKYIFPGGMLPTIPILHKQLAQAGLQQKELSAFGNDYAKTLQLWQTRFQHAWPRLSPLGFDDRFKRLWEQYLDYCAAGFKVGTIDVVQLTAVRD